MASIAHRAAEACDGAARARRSATPKRRRRSPRPAGRKLPSGHGRKASKDNVSLVAAGVAFYGFLAMVPLLGATVLTYGLIAKSADGAPQRQSLATSLPQDVAKLIGDQLMNVVKTSGGKKGLGLLVALAVALWGARNAAGSIVIALNIAYEEEEKRELAEGDSAVARDHRARQSLLAMVGAAAIGAMAQLEKLLPALGPVGAIAGKVADLRRFSRPWPRQPPRRSIATDRRAPKAKWTWITPGSLFFAIGWVVLTLGFGFYVSHFGKYNVTYGSLGGVIVLVTWLYLSSFILLFGAEFNSEVEHQTARDTTAEARRKPLGDRGAWSADHVADGPARRRQGGRAAGEQPLSDDPGSAVVGEAAAGQAAEPHEHPYLVARATNRAGAHRRPAQGRHDLRSPLDARPVAAAQARREAGGRGPARGAPSACRC